MSLRVFFYFFLIFTFVSDISFANLGDFSAGNDLSVSDYEFIGENSGDASGYVIAGQGNLDGDEFADIIIGSPLNDDSASNAGKVHVVLGASLTNSSSLDLSQADFVLLGENAGDYAGYAVSFVNDFDNDGLSEILVSAIWNDDFLRSAGKVYLVLSSSLHASNGILSLGQADYVFFGEAESDNVGYTLASGDFDGDSVPDILMSSVKHNSLQGKVYLFLGSGLRSQTSPLQVSQADYIFSGEMVGDKLGYTYANAGDVDGDGKDDILFGARGNDSNGDSSGKVYLVLGQSLGSSQNISIATADYYFLGEQSLDECGVSVASAGDVDGDGLADILFGAPGSSGYTGRSYLFLGNQFGTAGQLTITDAAFTFEGLQVNDYSGSYVSGVGDIDGDGLSDIAVGAYGSDDFANNAGSVFVFTGASLAQANSVLPVDQAQYILYGETSSDQAGYPFTSAGDFNGDGVDDLFLGVNSNDQAGTNAGKSYVVLGDCGEVANTLYVDGSLGSTHGVGTAACPYATISEALQEAANLSVSRIEVMGDWFYDETIVLDAGMELIGHLGENQGWPPFVYSSSTFSNLPEALLIGADNAYVEGFSFLFRGVKLEGVTGMTLQGNSIYLYEQETALALLSGSSHNTISNNLIMHHYDSESAMVFLEQNSNHNQFVNNTFHAYPLRTTAHTFDVVGVWLESSTTGNTFFNNIVHVENPYGTGQTYGFFNQGSFASANVAFNKVNRDNVNLYINGTVNLKNNRSPGFVNAQPSGTDYQLIPSSQCIDAGLVGRTYADSDGSRNDLGAYGGSTPLGF